MSSQQYIPRADGKFRAWAEVFVRTVHKNPPAFMFTSGQTEALKRSLDEFLEAYELTTGDDTRTRVTIMRKDDARSILEDQCRIFAGLIRTNRGISDDAKIAVGVPPINTSRRKRTCPQIAPCLSYIASTPGFDVLRVTDPVEGRLAKPYNAAGIEIWAAYTPPGTTAWPKRDEAKFLRTYPNGRIQIERDPERPDWHITFWARYVGHRHDTGPFSLPTSTRVPVAKAKKKPQQSNEQAHDDEGGEQLKKAA